MTSKEPELTYEETSKIYFDKCVNFHRKRIKEFFKTDKGQALALAWEEAYKELNNS